MYSSKKRKNLVNNVYQDENRKHDAKMMKIAEKKIKKN